MLSLNKRATARLLGSVGALALGLSAIVAQEARATLDFLIEETGDAANPSFVLKVEPSILALPEIENSVLESPQGQQISSADPSWNDDADHWEFDFPTYQSVLDFLDGQWGFQVDHRFFGPATLEFRFEELNQAVADHSAPLYISPGHDIVVKNREPFAIEWDYGWRDGAETRTFIRRGIDGPDPGSSSTFGPPDPNYTYYSTGGVRYRDYLIRTEGIGLLDEEIHRIEYTFDAEEPVLPVDFVYTIGVETSLNEHVWVGSTDSPVFFSPSISLAHERIGGQFTVTLSTVPEPSTLLLLSIAGVVGNLGSRRQILRG